MRAISSRPTSRIMRVLVLSALLACASAAPSGAFVAPLSVVAVPAVNSGDLQAALIDAKVQTEDYLRSIADKQRAAAEEVVVDQNKKLIEATDQAKERSLEAFWANEDKKWQALDAAQTAQAQIDGQLASTSDAVAKSLVVPAVQVAAPVVAPVPNYIYTPGLVAPALKAAEPVAAAPAAPEAPKEELKAGKPEEKKPDSVQVESASMKTANAPKPEKETKYVVGKSQLLSTLPIVPTLKFLPQVQPWGSVAFVQPSLKTIAVPFPGHVLAPTVLNTVW